MASETPDGTSESEIDPIDLEALTRAMTQARGALRGQLDSMLKDRPWLEVAKFAAYCQQFDNLRLRPWQLPPCCVASDGGEEPAAELLLRRLLDANLSPWEPDPMRALEQAQARRAKPTRAPRRSRRKATGEPEAVEAPRE
jgi:hypothetical protein